MTRALAMVRTCRLRSAKFRQGWRPMSSLSWVDKNVLAPPAISADHDFSPINKTDGLTETDSFTGSAAKV
jgi:hypothetical protein